MSEKNHGRKGNGHKGKERGKGAGSLEWRKSGYIARWTVDGKRYAQSTGTTDKRDAEAKLAEFVAPFRLKDKEERLEAFVGKLGGVQKRIEDFEEARPAMLIADAWDAFRKSPNRKDTAGAARLVMCERWARQFCEFMAKRYADITEIRKVTKEHAQAYAAEGFTEVSNAVRNQTISFLHMMWRVLIADGTARIAANVWDGIQKKHETHTRRRELTVEELKRVCADLRGEMRLLFAVGIYTGLRLGDCALLEWGQVDLARRRIALIPRKTARKTGRMVVIPIHPNLLNMLADVAADRRGYVMPECAELYRRSTSKMSRRIQRIFKRAGIDTVTDGQEGKRKRAAVSFHSLRHTFVSLSANAGVPLAVVQAIVGHSTVDMTRHYFHESEQALMSAVAALPDVIGGGSGAAAGGATSPRVRTICAMVAELTDAERGELMRHLNGGAAGGNVAVDVPTADVPTVAALPCAEPCEPATAAA